MRDASKPRSDGAGAGNGGKLFPSADWCTVAVTLDVAAGCVHFEWLEAGTKRHVATGRIVPQTLGESVQSGLECWISPDARFAPGAELLVDGCSSHATSVRALLKRLRERFPLVKDGLHLGLRSAITQGAAKAGERLALRLAPGGDVWKWLGREVAQFALGSHGPLAGRDAAERGRYAMTVIVGALLGTLRAPPPPPAPDPLLDLRVEFYPLKAAVTFRWTAPGAATPVATGAVRCAEGGLFHWTLETGGRAEEESTQQHRNAIHDMLSRWFKRFATNPGTFVSGFVKPQLGSGEAHWTPRPLPPEVNIYDWIEGNLLAMAEERRLRGRHPPDPYAFESAADAERYERRLARKEEKRAEEAVRRQAVVARFAEERRLREARETTTEVRRAPPAAPAPRAPQVPKPPRLSAALPPVSVAIKLPPLAFQETALPLADLRDFALRERAALWWVSNQSDDLLCLPHCRIRRLEYQVRTALRVLGPLRGRALLSDEVGLGKTIEAGLVLKELLTRGMVKKFLVLTLPSLVDQWAEELNDKFGVATVTTNQPGVREEPARLWRENPGIVASLHTLKQPAHLAVAREVHWDLLIVDEAHYLRNRDSQAWQAVNVLPRQFLLLLTATPVQNSLEELYNLVTLLMPGQLPTPREFRARFLDPKRPRQPREPEELRRLLGQVMIRNTRANAGVDLPPRHAETVVFAPDEPERTFWQQWEFEFRVALTRLNASQSSLWGRLLLRAAGSSPAAWRSALAKFPDAAAARAWRDQSPLTDSWRRKCAAIVPLARGAGGVVVFTEFLETQAALAEFLRGAGGPVFVINGATPAATRQPITEEFRAHGGALVLTHSGTEGRNLQFCHCLANFDLPWNPMEIEQRIGRLHRLGQQHPVRIYNFVQAGTLQEHLLQILQDKLNLFELVVGETGLVLGERFSGDEFEEEIFRRWRESEGRVAEALAGLGEELAAARDQYAEVKQLDETLFAKDYESL